MPITPPSGSAGTTPGSARGGATHGTGGASASSPETTASAALRVTTTAGEVAGQAAIVSRDGRPVQVKVMFRLPRQLAHGDYQVGFMFTGGKLEEGVPDVVSTISVGPRPAGPKPAAGGTSPKPPTPGGTSPKPPTPGGTAPV